MYLVHAAVLVKFTINIIFDSFWTVTGFFIIAHNSIISRVVK